MNYDNDEIKAICSDEEQLTVIYRDIKNKVGGKTHVDRSKVTFLIESRIKAQNVLEYVCRVKNIPVVSKDSSETTKLTLGNYLYAVRKAKMLPAHIDRQFDNIMDWGNHRGHNSDQINDSTVDSVNDSFQEILNWFFREFLEGKYIDYRKNLYSHNTGEKSPEEMLAKAKENFEKNPLNIPDYSILLKSKKIKKKKRGPARIISIIIVLCLAIGSFKLYQNYQENDREEKALFYLERFLNSSNKSEFNPYDYFADKVDVYITHKNVTPDSIFKIRHKNEEYLERHFRIMEGSLKFQKDSAGVSYWRFINDFRCKMPNNPPEKRYWSAKVMTEIGYNSDYKITRYMEIHPFLSRQWSSEKPY